jgi:hypothetical protein
MRDVYLLCMVGSLLACGGGTAPNDGGSDSGTGTDTGVANAAETAACRNLFTLAPTDGCLGGVTESECVASLVMLRANASSCTTQFNAYLSCLTRLTACTGPADLCSTEYDAFSACANPQNPLIGVWSMSVCTGTEKTSCSYALGFSSDGSYTNTAIYTNATTASTYAGCDVTEIVSGFTWTSTATTISVAEGASPTGLVTRSGCTNSADDTPQIPNPDFVPIYWTLTDEPYTISGTQLNFLGFVFTRL